MSWQEQTKNLQDEINFLYSSQAQSEIDTISPREIQKLNNYIKTGGTSDVPPSSEHIYSFFYKRIENVIRELTQKVKEVSKNTDLTGKLAEIGRIQQELLIKKDRLTKAKQEADASQTRDMLLRAHKTDITRDNLFLLGRPIKKSSIPYLWMSSALFAFLAITVLLVLIPSMSTDPLGVFSYGQKLKNQISTSALGQYAYGPSILEQIKEIATSTSAYIIYAISILMIIVMLSLKAGGVL